MDEPRPDPRGGGVGLTGPRPSLASGAFGQPAFYRQIAQFDQAFTDEIEPSYGPIDCPVQILWGEHDRWVPVSQGRKLADLMTSGRIRIIPGAGHLLQEDAPEAIVAAMLDPCWS
ncbi:hypothetical protein C0V75_21865 [Tabrizicola sp. TH137]|uniref:alpha/beta fold hydrolase n=1 Tax=Tabrizicola sp. TH137 TaxID=2067452 RepID=UPI000C79E4ED|nr:alpha/beta hydrolase [Tabrizicola sp. TH137]PLL10195.1 hypothetical protein C0V75_21865 [Tabrizicola sp. TH137]